MFETNMKRKKVGQKQVNAQGAIRETNNKKSRVETEKLKIKELGQRQLKKLIMKKDLGRDISNTCLEPDKVIVYRERQLRAGQRQSQLIKSQTNERLQTKFI